MNWVDKKSCNHEEVLKVLPHRYPFLMIDRVLEIQPGKPLKIGMSLNDMDEAKVGSYVKALKNVTFNEAQFQGHFPNNPVFPGVLTLETLAQSAAFILVPFLATQKNGELVPFNVALASFDKARFRKPIFPGDQLILHSRLVNFRKNIYSFEGDVSVDGKVVAEASFMAQVY